MLLKSGDRGISGAFRDWKEQKTVMNQKIKNAIDEYVFLLPDLYSTPNDHSRLVNIAYVVEVNNEGISDDFKEVFFNTLSHRFNNYENDVIQTFYQERLKQIEDYSYVISVLKSMELLKVS